MVRTKKPAFLFVQNWEESERGWGVRPDGCSVHLTREDAKRFTDAFLERQHKMNGPIAPDEYSRPRGEVYATPFDPVLYAELKKALKFNEAIGGIWHSKNSLPRL